MTLPTVSIVVASYQRPTQVLECLRALEALDYPRERLEIIVVDDGSMPPYSLRPDAQAEQRTLLLRLEQNGGSGMARNFGVERASGEWIAFTDDDCLPRADWLRRLVERQQQSPEAMAGGHTINGLPENPYTSASQALVDLLYEHYNAEPQRARFFTGNNMLMRRVDFHAVGGFLPAFWRFAEDRNLCARWLASGRPLIYVPEAQVVHRHHLTLGSFWRQHVRYGRGARRFHRALTEDGLSPTVEPGLYARLAKRILRESLRQPRLAALLALTQPATFCGLALDALSALLGRE